MFDDILEQHIAQDKAVVSQIEALNLPYEWGAIFVETALSRGRVSVNDDLAIQMMQIAETDSPAVKLLGERKTLVGIVTLHTLSAKIEDEKARLTAVESIFKTGVKLSRNTIDLLVAEKLVPNLFNYQEVQ